MKRELTFHPEFTLLYEDAGNSTARQIDQVKSLMNRGIDLLIISPNEAAPFAKVIEAVFRKGIPVILLDRKIDTEPTMPISGAITLKLAGWRVYFIGTHLKGKGRVIEVWGLPSSSPAQERHRGFREALRKYPGCAGHQRGKRAMGAGHSAPGDGGRPECN